MNLFKVVGKDEVRMVLGGQPTPFFPLLVVIDNQKLRLIQSAAGEGEAHKLDKVGANEFDDAWRMTWLG